MSRVGASGARTAARRKPEANSNRQFCFSQARRVVQWPAGQHGAGDERAAVRWRGQCKLASSPFARGAAVGCRRLQPGQCDWTACMCLCRWNVFVFRPASSSFLVQVSSSSLSGPRQQCLPRRTFLARMCLCMGCIASAHPSAHALTARVLTAFVRRCVCWVPCEVRSGDAGCPLICQQRLSAPLDMLGILTC